MIRFNWKYFLCCVAIVLALCAAQISGSTALILLCGVAFMAVVMIGCYYGFTLPMLLFFLPWSPILRTAPDSFSFYTIGLVMICALSAVKNWRHFKPYHLMAAVVLVIITAFSKLLEGSSLALDYICFILMIAVFPVLRQENTAKKYDFYQVAVFFSAGVIIAALCAQQFASYGNIAKYIRVDSYSTIVRRCGFYGDPNFYTAQITAALGGCLLLILNERAKARSILLGILLLLLLYCGFLSGSKSFVLITGVLVLLWTVELLKMRGRAGLKTMLILGGALAVVYIATSSLFSGLIDVLVTRFSSANDMDSFTTGRTELWESYYDVITNDWKTLFFGKGFTNLKVNGRASHNTIIQMIFQFGLVGTPVLVSWIVGFWRKINNTGGTMKMRWTRILILLTGAFLPWMAIDVLFFDEFFLFQWFCFMGIQALASTTGVPAVRGKKLLELKERLAE